MIQDALSLLRDTGLPAIEYRWFYKNQQEWWGPQVEVRLKDRHWKRCVMQRRGNYIRVVKKPGTRYNYHRTFDDAIRDVREYLMWSAK